MTEGTGATPWYQGVEGFDAEAIGHLQAKGYDKLDAPKAAAALLKSWKEAERFVGAPANEIVRLPKDMNDATAMKAVWQRLGAPADKAEYKFDGLKFGDGTEVDAAFTDFLRGTAAELNLPKDAASRLASALVKHFDGAEAADKAEREAALAQSRDGLKKNWGTNYETNMLVARRAAEALGAKPEDVAALESVIGYDRVMEMFRKIGAQIGEDKFIQSRSGTGGAMTREEAVSRKAELMNDSEWVKRYMNGGVPENREMTNLIQIIGAK